jgi:hypothetical protein
MQTDDIFHVESCELIALDECELDLVSGGRGRGNGLRASVGAINIDLDLNVAVIAGNVVLSSGDVLFSIVQQS